MFVIIVEIILIQIQLRWLCWWNDMRSLNYENLRRILIHLMKKKMKAETDKVWIDEQSNTIIQEMIEWKTESDDKNVLDIDNE